MNVHLLVDVKVMNFSRFVNRKFLLHPLQSRAEVCVYFCCHGAGRTNTDFFFTFGKNAVGRGGVDLIATCYGLDGSGIESRLGRDFPHPSKPALGPIQASVQWAPGLFFGSKAAGAWR